MVNKRRYREKKEDNLSYVNTVGGNYWIRTSDTDFADRCLNQLDEVAIEGAAVADNIYSMFSVTPLDVIVPFNY